MDNGPATRRYGPVAPPIAASPTVTICHNDPTGTSCIAAAMTTGRVESIVWRAAPPVGPGLS